MRFGVGVDSLVTDVTYLSHVLPHRILLADNGVPAPAHSACTCEGLWVVDECENSHSELEGEVLEEIALEEGCDLGVNEEELGGRAVC